MSVPFERLGTGQVGRLVYQVLGKNGPVYNPDNIRYLDPGDTSHVTPDMLSPFDASLALSSANLAVSSANLALTAYAVTQLRDANRKLDEVCAILGHLRPQVEEILQRVERIDIKVAEQALREALKHRLQRAVKVDGIFFQELAPLLDDLSQFDEALEDRPLFDYQLRVSSDVRDHLGLVFGLLNGLRGSVAIRTNRAAHGDPRRVVGIDPVADYLPNLELVSRVAVAYAEITGSIADTVAKVQDDIAKRFTFANDQDRAEIGTVLHESLTARTLNTLSELDYTIALLQTYFPEEPTTPVVPETLVDSVAAWLWHTDAGLLFRTRAELTWLQEGYPTIPEAELSDYVVAVDLDVGYLDRALPKLQDRQPPGLTDKILGPLDTSRRKAESNDPARCPKCGDVLGAGTTRCWTKGCDFVR